MIVTLEYHLDRRGSYDYYCGGGPPQGQGSQEQPGPDDVDKHGQPLPAWRVRMRARQHFWSRNHGFKVPNRPTSVRQAGAWWSLGQAHIARGVLIC